MSLLRKLITPEVNLILGKYISKIFEKVDVKKRFASIIDEIPTGACIFQEVKIGRCNYLKPLSNERYIQYIQHIIENYEELLKVNIHNYNDKFGFENDYKDIDLRINVSYHPFTKDNRSDIFKTVSFHEMIVDIMDYALVQKEIFPSVIRDLHLNTCVYCNTQFAIATDDNSAFYQLDHCLPKSKYPYLCTSFFNLQPSCGSCNQRKSSTDIRFGQYNLSMWKDSIEDDYYRFKIDHASLINYVKNIGSRKAEDLIVFLDCESSDKDIKTMWKEIEKKFHINGQYKHLDSVLEEIIWKHRIYSEGHTSSLSKTFISLFPDMEGQVDRLIWGNLMNKEEIFKRPLAKLYQDIKEQLDSIPPDWK